MTKKDSITEDPGSIMSIRKKSTFTYGAKILETCCVSNSDSGNMCMFLSRRLLLGKMIL